MDILSFFWNLFLDWIKTLFIIPFQNLEMLWLLVPVWLAWFFSEFYQEKVGTSIGNAITNAVVIVWASIDCARQTVSQIKELSSIDIFFRFALLLMLFVYGYIIIRLGIQGDKKVTHIGRIRNVTYVFAMFVPIYYNAIPLTLTHILASIIFFPVFYFVIEVIDRITPNPKAIIVDMEGSNIYNKNEIKKENILSPNLNVKDHSNFVHHPNYNSTFNSSNIHSHSNYNSSNYTSPYHQNQQHHQKNNKML